MYSTFNQLYKKITQNDKIKYKEKLQNKRELLHFHDYLVTVITFSQFLFSIVFITAQNNSSLNKISCIKKKANFCTTVSENELVYYQFSVTFVNPAIYPNTNGQSIFQNFSHFDFATGSSNFLRNILQNSPIVQKLKSKSRKDFGNSNILEGHGSRIHIPPERKIKIICTYLTTVLKMLHLRSILSTGKLHCVKSVRIRSYSGPYFPAFGLNTERYGESLRIQSECGKIRTRITPNTDTLYAVFESPYFQI